MKLLKKIQTPKQSLPQQQDMIRLMGIIFENEPVIDVAHSLDLIKFLKQANSSTIKSDIIELVTQVFKKTKNLEYVESFGFSWNLQESRESPLIIRSLLLLMKSIWQETGNIQLFQSLDFHKVLLI